MNRILISITLFLAIFTFIKVTLIDKIDIPRRVSEDVVGFRAEIGDGLIYGTGFHITHKGKTFIITNRHVCQAGLQVSLNNNVLNANGKSVKIIHIWREHDLCALESWKITGLRLADSAAEPLDKLYVIGHPNGINLVIEDGRFIEKSSACFSDTLCMSSSKISNNIMPGNSGSPVINEAGDVVGVVFAGTIHPFLGIKLDPNGNHMVPYISLKKFLNFISKISDDE